MILYILILKFLERRWEDKSLNRMVACILEFNLLLIFLLMQFWSVTVVLKYLNFATFSKDLLAFSILLFCPVFWWWDTTIYLVASVFTPRPTSLLASNRASVFLFMYKVL
jgi:hypothetical protein